MFRISHVEHPVDADVERAELHVNLVHEYENILKTTRNLEQFESIRRSVLEEAAEAAAMSERYERLANLWRGLDLNLTLLKNRMPEEYRLARIRDAEETRRLATLLPTSIEELIRRIQNVAQGQALQRLLYRHENNQLYLSAYEANPETHGRTGEVEGTFTILGTVRNHARESYAVKWYRLAAGKPSFWCNCPDHKFNSTKKNMMCKHICFLVAKVGRILDPAFFETKRFTAEQHEAFKTTVGNAAIFTTRPAFPTLPTLPTRPIVSSSVADRRATFLECRKPVEADDSCPICYDTMSGVECLNCPTCSNNVHRECMEVWLERHSTCVYCRSEVWRSWR